MSIKNYFLKLNTTFYVFYLQNRKNRIFFNTWMEIEWLIFSYQLCKEKNSDCQTDRHAYIFLYEMSNCLSTLTKKTHPTSDEISDLKIISWSKINSRTLHNHFHTHSRSRSRSLRSAWRTSAFVPHLFYEGVCDNFCFFFMCGKLIWN